MRVFFAMIFVLLLSCGRSDIKTIVIRGSDTEVNLVLRLAETYMETHDKVSVAVTGGGSGTGIAALINKKTDIANSSRSFKKAELRLAEERGVDVIPIIFAVDALSFIVHPDLSIDALSIADIRSIYTGQIDNWNAVGGPDLPISLYGRQGNSGTFTFIQTEILKADYDASMKQMNGTSQIIESIKNDKAGIGYVGIGYIVNKTGEQMEGVKVLSIAEENKEVSPLETAAIINGDYPIVRPLYQYLDGYPAGVLKAFLEYELSDKGQTIISENGYFPITKKHRQQNQKYLSHE